MTVRAARCEPLRRRRSLGTSEGRLVDVLAQAGPRFDPAIKNDKLRHFVSVSATDGYRALVAYGEIDPSFENKDVLLATSEDGRPLDAEGPRLVVPGDIAGGRYVTKTSTGCSSRNLHCDHGRTASRWLTRLTVVNAAAWRQSRTPGMHAGNNASIIVRVNSDGSRLRFSVTDDGAGLATGPDGAHNGHGFLDMRDRLGAIGGTLDVESAPGSGTTVGGSVSAIPIGAGE